MRREQQTSRLPPRMIQTARVRPSPWLPPAAKALRESRKAEQPEAIPGGHPMTTPIPGGRHGRDQREPPQHLQQEIHGSDASPAGP